MQRSNALQFGLGAQAAGIFGAAPPEDRRQRKLGSTVLFVRIRRPHIALPLAGLLVLTGCDPTKRVPEGRYLLKRNVITVPAGTVNTGELRSIIKQKPNKKILGLQFYLTAYNLPDPERMAAKRARKDQRRDELNEERAERGKAAKPYKRTFGQWLREVVGEPPVLLDSSLTERTVDQLELYVHREGWFRAAVRDTVHFRHSFLGRRRGLFKQRKAEVEYVIDPGPMYRYRNVRFTVDDPLIQQYVQSEWKNSKVVPGDRFDVDVLDEERTRIAGHLRELGYLFFTRDLIRYDADTAVGDHQVDIVLRLERPVQKGRENGLAGTPEGTVYTIDDITVATMRRPFGGIIEAPDTLRTGDHAILYQDRLRYKPQALLNGIFLQPNERFRQSNADRTYRRLTGLRVFDRVDITYDTTGTGRPGVANARIDLLPGKEQSMSLEGFGTNRGGFLGTSVSLGYRHRNLFRGMGSVQTQLVLGLEAQQSFTGAGSSNAGNVGGDGLFNTIDIGPEITFRFPNFLLPIKRDRFSRSSAPRTAISLLYNYQKRPDYGRTLAKMSFGYEWNESRYNTFGFFPIEINVIKIPQKSDDFVQYLTQANDPVLTDSYTDHLIAGMRGQFTLNTQENTRSRNVFFARITAEWAAPVGFLGTDARDTAGNAFSTVAGIRYAEFIKVDSDLRWRRLIHEKSSAAFRVAAGVGVPYGNLPVLPFESSFFVGGANGLRAWRARSIGPGSYSAPLVAFDRIGELRIEGNAEYRFKLVGLLEGALFADVGNIWNLKEDPRKPGAAFSEEFISELAVGTGVGMRLNFDFFIVRFDLGMQTKDPSLPPGERWLFQPKDTYETRLTELNGSPSTYRTQFNFNLGIGYPF